MFFFAYSKIKTILFVHRCVSDNLGPPATPTMVDVGSVTAISVNLSWVSGLDGGHPQTYHVLVRPAGTTSSSSGPLGEPIHDPGLRHRVQHTVTGLEPNTNYYFQVVTKNMYGSQESVVVGGMTLGK